MQGGRKQPWHHVDEFNAPRTLQPVQGQAHPCASGSDLGRAVLGLETGVRHDRKIFAFKRFFDLNDLLEEVRHFGKVELTSRALSSKRFKILRRVEQHRFQLLEIGVGTHLFVAPDPTYLLQIVLEIGRRGEMHGPMDVWDIHSHTKRLGRDEDVDLSPLEALVNLGAGIAIQASMKEVDRLDPRAPYQKGKFFCMSSHRNEHDHAAVLSCSASVCARCSQRIDNDREARIDLPIRYPSASDEALHRDRIDLDM